MKVIKKECFDEFYQTVKEKFGKEFYLYDTCGRQYVYTDEPMTDEFIAFLHEYLQERNCDAVINSSGDKFRVIELENE